MTHNGQLHIIMTHNGQLHNITFISSSVSYLCIIVYICYSIYYYMCTILHINSFFITGDTERVKYGEMMAVELDSSVKKCEDVMTRLINKQQSGKEWTLDIKSSSPVSTVIIINDLNNCTVRELYIWSTTLDRKCVSTLSKKLAKNKTMKILWLSPLHLLVISNKSVTFFVKIQHLKS